MQRATIRVSCLRRAALRAAALAITLGAVAVGSAEAQTHMRLEPDHRDLRTVLLGTPYRQVFKAINGGQNDYANGWVSIAPGPGISYIYPSSFVLPYGSEVAFEVVGTVPQTAGPFTHVFDFYAEDVNGYVTYMRGAVIGNASPPTFGVGVIPNSAGCPSGSPLITMHMDDEDSNNANSRSGWLGAITSNSNTTFRFCRVDGRQFRPLSTIDTPANHYAVLKLGTTCPAGSTEFQRFFDNQDDRLGAPNANSASSSSGNLSDIDPNNWRGNTTLNFCLFKSGSSTMSQFPTLGIRYGVFAAPGFSKSVSAGRVPTDDEDSNNKNAFYGDAAGRAIIAPTGSDGRNTTLYTALVTPETRPVARCTNSPTYGNVRVESIFDGRASYAQPGRSLMTSQWSWTDGSAASGLGPHTRVFYHYSGPSGSSRTFSGTLTVTDNAGESSSATCYVTVYFP
jgi:hypothetical protein